MATALEPLTDQVPGCPEWDVAALVAHTGRVHRRVTEVIRRRPAKPLPPTDAEAPAGGAASHRSWFLDGLRSLAAVLDETDPGTSLWTWHRPDQSAAFWYRRMALETAVHRWDAQSAHGAPEPVDTALAVDGIAELAEVFLPRLRSRRPGLAIPGTLHVHVSDAKEGEWVVENDLSARRGHVQADAAVRGPASDVLMLLWGRPPWEERLDIIGEVAIVDAWRSEVRF